MKADLRRLGDALSLLEQVGGLPDGTAKDRLRAYLEAYVDELASVLELQLEEEENVPPAARVPVRVDLTPPRP